MIDVGRCMLPPSASSFHISSKRPLMDGASDCGLLVDHIGHLIHGLLYYKTYTRPMGSRMMLLNQVSKSNFGVV